VLLGWLRKTPKQRPADSGQSAADRAVKHEQTKLAAAHKETRKIHAEAGTLKRLGEQNDFAGKLRRAMGGAG
jgi:hypothetical protein